MLVSVSLMCCMVISSTSEPTAAFFRSKSSRENFPQFVFALFRRPGYLLSARLLRAYLATSSGCRLVAKSAADDGVKILQFAFVVDFIVGSHAAVAASSRPGGEQYSLSAGKMLGMPTADKAASSTETESLHRFRLSTCSCVRAFLICLPPLCRHVMRMCAHISRS